MTRMRITKGTPASNRSLAALGLICLAILTPPPTRSVGAEPAGEDSARFFRERIEPVLREKCYGCHAAGAKKVRGGLKLDAAEALRLGGDTGPAVVPGKADESPLIRAIRRDEGLEMPPEGPGLAKDVVADFATWVNRGAIDPRGEDAGKTSAGATVGSDPRDHWAFRRVVKPELPRVRDSQWARNPIDAFVLARLEQRGWSPAPEAARRDWIRRVTFDLTGLPPSPSLVEDFVADADPRAYENVVDALLSSPAYGEHWAQHWLDVVRFAESEGFEYDRHLNGAWRYRDYTIDAFNRDKPFDRFVFEQLAGDEAAPGDRDCQAASVFHRLGPVRRNAGDDDVVKNRNEVLTERTDIIGSAFLGLTIGCARCHDHKLEPISQKDYYRLEAYLASTEEHEIIVASETERITYDKRASRINQEIRRLKARMRQSTGKARERLARQLEVAEDLLPPPLPGIAGTRNDHAHRTPIHVLRRGVWGNKGEAVGPRPPSVLVPRDFPELKPDVADPRTQLARWLTDSTNPLTARVLVNRLWQHHFGAGLVRTVNDFGLKGDRPSHPELLDWLAATLVEGGWHLKPIHRMIVLSATYRQASSSQAPGADRAMAQDPEGRLLWHFRRRRLDAEEIRDAMLTVAGRLEKREGGPSVMVPVDAELVRLLYKPSQWRVTGDEREHDRRSIYLIAKRNLRLPFMETFDAPALTTSCPRRETSTHAPQALELLNGTLSNRLAEAFAARLRLESDGTPRGLVERAFRLALGRPPSATEMDLSTDFLRDEPLKEFALAMFNLNEFLHVP